MNKLFNSSSKYLRSHANDLVNWHLWNKTTLELAKIQDKPIFLSIGYNACHWCHVMQQEAFNNPEIANFLNNFFISIKVDKEQRPDIDHVYMEYVVSTTGSGGWPLNVFLTPNLIPFYGGTYFPATNKFGRISFLELLNKIYNAYLLHRNEIEEKNNIFFQITTIENKSIGQNFDEFDFDYANYLILQNSDKIDGGIGNTIKFPHYPLFQYLFKYYYFTKNENIKDFLIVTLNSMIQGGFYDLIDGGFHRYSTNKDWSIPHFEKMLYDNIEMINLYTNAFKIFDIQDYKEVAIETANFVLTQLKSSKTLFYTSIDADYNHIEGDYYIFSEKDFQNALAPRLLQHFEEFFNLIEFENRFIITKSLYFPNKTNPRYQIAKEIIISLKKYREKFKNKHIIDDKIITSNNLNLANALLNLYKITQDKNYYNLSHQILNTILRKGFDNEILLHQINHKSIDKIYAFLDDYNALISLLISFYELTANINYLLKAKYFMDFVIKNYFDNKNFILHYTNKLLSDLPINPEIYQDTPIKSPVSHFLENIYYLSIAFENQDYENIFNTLIKNNFSTYKMYPIHYAGMLDIAFTSLKHKNEIVISFPKEVDINLLLKFHKKFLPQAIIFPCKSNEQIEIPILSDKLSIQNKITYYYCENFSCQAPLFDENQIFDLLGYYNLAH
jgi:uncharacterized protein YyaL (SSP411 family)